MTLSHLSVSGIALSPKKLCPQIPVQDVGLIPLTVDRRSLCEEDPDVMKHSGLLDEGSIKGELRMCID